MLELHRYFPAILLDLTWELEAQLEIQRIHDGPHNVSFPSGKPHQRSSCTSAWASSRRKDR